MSGRIDDLGDGKSPAYWGRERTRSGQRMNDAIDRNEFQRERRALIAGNAPSYKVSDVTTGERWWAESKQMWRDILRETGELKPPSALWAEADEHLNRGWKPLEGRRAAVQEALVDSKPSLAGDRAYALETAGIFRQRAADVQGEERREELRYARNWLNEAKDIGVRVAYQASYEKAAEKAKDLSAVDVVMAAREVAATKPQSPEQQARLEGIKAALVDNLHQRGLKVERSYSMRL